MTVLLARGLARAGLCVVSGGARGIDAAAHRGAVEAGGRSVAVLGSGIDALYPRRNASLLLSLLDRGCIVSEYPPGVPAEPFRFPARNRLVAALAAAIVVVEGTAGSGALITADHAMELGREVFAVPGPVSSALAAAPLRLLRDGARLIRGPGDLLEDLGVTSVPPAGSVPNDGPAPQGLTGRVLAALAGPTDPGNLAATLGAPLPEVLAALVRLELGGQVRRVGGRFERRTLAAGAGP
jgi:DNA processing protein